MWVIGNVASVSGPVSCVPNVASVSGLVSCVSSVVRVSGPVSCVLVFSIYVIFCVIHIY
jgi:hypothetical protein